LAAGSFAERSKKMKVGDAVKFKTPQSSAEENARFIIVEARNMMGRVKIQLICDMIIKPIELVDESEIDLARDTCDIQG